MALTAHIAGLDRRTVTRWADRSQGPAEGEKNLRAAFQVFGLIDAPTTGRACFMGTNPQPQDVSLVEALAEGRHRQAMAAAQAFVREG